MSNDLVHFKEGPRSGAFAWADPNEESLSDGIGASYGVIGYRGGRWTLKYRGQKYMITRPDGTPEPWLHCIIIGQARQKSKSFYEKYEDGSDDPPICSSFDGITPDVAEPVAPTCAVCPKNVLYINPETGKRTTDCKDHKRLAVLLLPAITQKLFGEPLLEPVFLRVPAASLQNLSLMGDQAKAMGHAFYTYVTRISFDPNVPYPKMVFEAIQLLQQEQEPLIKELRTSSQTDRIITGGGLARPALNAPAQRAALPTGGVVDTGFGTAAAPTTARMGPPMIEAKANPVQETVAMPPSNPPLPQGRAAPMGVDLGGFGGSGTTTQGPTVVQAAPQNAVRDEGPAIPATKAMNDKLAALMPKE